MSDITGRIASLSPEKRALLEKRLLRKNSSPIKESGIQRRGTSGPCPLSFSQERLWLYNQIEPDVPNIIPFILRIKGQVNLNALKKSLDAIVARHESLRTTFSSEAGEPFQVIHPVMSIGMTVIDLGVLPEAEREAESQRLIDAELKRQFDLSADFMLRATLIRLSDLENILILIMHHIASDGWSTGIFFRELSLLYRAFEEHRDSALPDLPVQYADFACWQRTWMKGEVLEKQLSYWQTQLYDIPAVLDLPTDRPRPANRSNQGASHSVILSKRLIDRLRCISKQEGVTMFTLMSAAFKTLLYRYTNQGDICLGTFVANRNRVEIENLIGFFVNTLVLRTDLSDNPGFLELLRREHHIVLGAFAHQDIPFEKLLEILHPGRDISHTPLFQVALSFENMPKVPLDLPNLSFEFIAADPSVSLYDMSLIIVESPGGMKICFTYRTDIFDASTIRRWADNFLTLLEGIASNPEASVETLPLLTDAEKRRVLGEWNNTASYYLQDLCIHEMFEEQVEKTPHAAAVICDGQELTYRALNDRANQLAHYLRKQGVGPEVLVGICVDRSLEMVVGLLGILKAGGAYVPMDPAYPQERLKFIAEDAGIFVLVALERLMAGFPADDNIVICLDRDWEDIARESKENPAHYASPDSMAYVIYTSGSTGRPKGVVIEHGSVACFTGAVILQYGIVPADRVLQFASISFDASVEEIYPCLASGATLVLRTDDMLTSVHDFLKKCAEWELTVLDLPTAYWHELVLGLETDKLTIPDSVRVMIIGGEKALPERLLQWRRRVGAKVRLVNTYGPTEATVAATLCDLTSMNTENVLYGNVPIGRPMPHMKAHIFDPFLQPVPIGASGELYIGGAGVARGYLKRPELTVEKFIPDPFDGNTHGRLYKTGDLVRYLPDGNIEFLGRLDHQVKIRGYRIEPGEIESVLRQHSCVKETVVLAGENHRSYRELIAYIVPDKGSGISAGELRSHLSRHLPEYMIPTIFVVLDALPMTPSGKVDRRALHEHDRERPDCEHDFVEPRTPAEELVGGIWSNVLGLKAVGIHDNFFELGGHSLMATQVISRVRTAFQVEIPLRRLFETPTVEGLAEAVSEALSAKQRQSAPPIVAVAREGRLPLSFAQERLWFLGQLDPHSAAYNIPLVLRLTGQLNVTAMEKGLGEILRRHEVLRTTFITENDQPSQRIGPAGAFLLWQVDLSEMPEEQREAEVLRLANEEATRPFDLEKGPLLKAALLRLSGQEHVLLLTVHHIVSDGWSTGIIYRELSALYEAFSQGMPSPLPELPIQYADFAIWQRQWLQGDILETQLAYWKKQLTGNLPILELPTDHVRPAVRTFRGDIHTLQFPQDLKGAIQKLSHEEGMTLFMVLLAAFQCLLHRYTGQDDIIVGTPIANRNHEKIERLTGCFVNTLVMRTTLSGDPSFRELLKQVRTVSLDAYAHQDLPFEKLVEELRPARDLSHTPLFQVMFALQNEPVPALRLTDLTLSPIEIGEKRTKFDLEVSLWETEEGLSSAFVYSTDLFDATTIERMACHYQRILSGVSGNPDLRISELPLTTETEQHQLLREFNNTTSDFPDDKCIHELFEEQAEKTPDATAVVFGDDHLTYRDLNRKADELAHYLRKQGVAAEVLVGICVERSLHMVIGALGILKAGGAYVPLDPSYPKERLAFMVKDTKAPLILTQKKLQGVLPKHAARVVLLDSEPEIIAEDDNTAPAGNAHADNLAYVIYTSGSTGRPKGVCVPHRAINRLVMNTNYIKIESSDRIAQASSFSFDAVTFELWGALLHGACLVGITRDVLLSAEAFSRHIKSSGISVLFLTTALFNQMAREVPTAFSSIRYLLIGGEIVDTDCVRTVVNTAPPQYLLHVYGPTENTTFTSWYQVDNVPAHARTIPIGKPLSNTTIYLLDRSLQTVPVGVPGELYAGGDGLARGYLNRPELNAVKFIPDPFGTNPGARLYKTGDIARYRSDGNIEFLGRIDNQVKIRGFRIEPGEIEAALRRHPAVEETVVLVREDHPGNKRIVAYVVPHAESTVTMNELRGLLKMQLPDYMVPGVFVHIDALPLTVNGKIDRTALPKPEYIQPEKENLYVAPRNELEKALVKTWEKVLRIKPVGIADNFFELGGHSLLTVQMIAEIRKTTGKNVKVMDIFRFPTIRQLAVQINKEGCSLQFTSLYPIESAGDKPPFFWIHGDESNIHLPRYIDPGQPLYGFAHQGQDRRSFPYRTVEEIAAHYLEELRTLQPEGPYMLGGYCFGALVALEMAQMMFKNAQHVHMLFLIDPSVYGFSNLKYADNVLPKTDTYFFSRVRHHRKRISSLSYTEKMVHAFQTAGNILRGTGDRLKKSKKIQRVLCRILLFAGLPLTKDLRRFYLLEELYAKAIRSYTLRKYPGRIVLCMSDEAGSGIEPFWSTLAEKGLKVHVVPESTHIGISGILEQQHVAVWARWLNTYLNEV